MTTVILRMVWSTKQSQISLAIAAQIFVNAGILLVYIINLLLVHRILRSLQPKIGWNSALNIILGMMFGLIAISLVLIVTFTVLTLYTLNQHIRIVTRDIQKAAITYLLIIAVLPLIILLLAFFLPHHSDPQLFGHGSIRSKAIVLGIGTCLCTLIAGFRAGTTWEAPRPINNPAWYDNKASFYIFNFTLEVSVIYLYILARIDKRFHVPDGSGKVRTYEISKGSNKTENEVASNEERDTIA
jgi:Protein of unknown function (DUF3112)